MTTLRPTVTLTAAERPVRRVPWGPVGGLLISGALVLAVVFGFGGALAVPLRWTAAAMGAICGCVVAAWAEERLYVAAAGRGAAVRVSLGLFVPLVAGCLAVLGASYLRPVLDRAGDPYVIALTVFAAFGWMASASLGSLLVIVLDLLISSLVTDLRQRITLAVLGLVLLTTGGAMGLSRAIPVVAQDVQADRETFAARLGTMALRPHEIEALLQPPPAKLTEGWASPAVTRYLGGAPRGGSFTLLFFALAALLAFPAVVSACAKLADATMERLHPLRRAFHLLAKGRLDVRVEEAGSADFVLLNRHFNQMVVSLGHARQAERAFGLYVSEQVLARIRSQHGEVAIPAALRHATVFFADIRGFTTLSERLEPSQVLSVLNRYFEAVVPVVEEHEGYLDKFIGDAMVVVFNGPIDQADHPTRAVRCAIALQQKLSELNAARVFPETGALEVGVGVATGPLVAGNLGSARKMEYTVIGDTVNLASRLTSHAGAGEVLVNEACAQALPPDVPRVPLGSIQVKGKERPVSPSRVWPVSAQASLGVDAKLFR